ncbi:DUF72 domain-containing protein [Thermocrinis minervae]|uniref:Uncharacterized conserved protein YecE, DUF72 family n=1 Tax=Thermocrinis minervae TaxID=381751 RepID=A0A1M6S7T5_9AQUI|nr:DUF72 domain-containing protein [Thermocrinis minervae]SHK40795.1 Uncharacterized conserved protein YecE, DUF72 family [Thermocrinis minervae]
MRVYIGCSGFYYPEWIGLFYPPHIKRDELLRYYEKYFVVVELNFSFYRFPDRGTLKSMLSRTRELKFSLKANRLFTHVRSYTQKDVDSFLYQIEPLLKEEERFIALLFQFPESFHYSEESLAYIEKLAKDFSGVQKVIEVRSKSFKRADFYSFLEGIGFSLVNVDAPKKGFLVGPWVSVGSINYVRIHGRNEENPYDYLYSLEELKKLRDKIKKLGDKDTYVFFNNTPKAKAVYNALELKNLMGYPADIPKSLERSFLEREWE